VGATDSGLERIGGDALPPRTADRQAQDSLFCPSPAISPLGGGLVTLWDLLVNYAERFFYWGQEFAKADARFDEWVATEGDAPFSEERMEYVRDFNRAFLQESQWFCAALELKNAEKHRLRLVAALATGAPPLTWRRFRELFDRLREAIGDDLGDRVFYYVKPEDAEVYNFPPPPWDSVVIAFPSTFDDILSAWRCLALGQPTASAFHALRVAERGLQQLAKITRTKLAKIADTENWFRLIEAIEIKVIAMPDLTKAKRDLKVFLLDTISTLTVIKEVWRDHAMHARTTYDDPEARIILIAVGRTMGKLSLRFYEEGGMKALPPASPPELFTAPVPTLPPPPSQ
jgi:hypothetical protein